MTSSNVSLLDDSKYSLNNLGIFFLSKIQILTHKLDLQTNQVILLKMTLENFCDYGGNF